MAQTDKYVRCVIATKNRVPSIILYVDRQIQELKSFCFKRPYGSVLGFDKTYNLGSMFVTSSVYKNSALIRRRTNDCPIFIGPLFIHEHSDVETYGQFFGHLSLKLIDCNQQQLTLGSDDELAVRKCFKHFFPRSSTVTCAQHLKKNVTRKLDELLGSSSDVRKRLMAAALFGINGLITCDDEVSFDASVDKLRRGVFVEGPPAFLEYFDSRIITLMRENVVAGPSCSTWTNNNCESINHVLKQSVKWQLTQIPDLIDKLRDLVECQYNDADRAICGLGDYALRPAYAKHRCTTEFWRSMSDDQRRKATASCFHRPGVATSTSTDGALTIPLATGGSKKPNQVKRARNAKTRSLKRVRVAAENGDEED